MFSGGLMTAALCLLVREGDRGRLRPRSRAVFRRRLAAGSFQPGDPSLSGGVPLLMPGHRGVWSWTAAEKPERPSEMILLQKCPGVKGERARSQA